MKQVKLDLKKQCIIHCLPLVGHNQCLLHTASVQAGYYHIDTLNRCQIPIKYSGLYTNKVALLFHIIQFVILCSVSFTTHNVKAFRALFET